MTATPVHYINTVAFSTLDKTIVIDSLHQRQLTLFRIAVKELLLRGRNRCVAVVIVMTFMKFMTMMFLTVLALMTVTVMLLAVMGFLMAMVTMVLCPTMLLAFTRKMMLVVGLILCHIVVAPPQGPAGLGCFAVKYLLHHIF